MSTTRQVTTRDAAAILGVSQRTAIRWADSGILRVDVKVPGPTGARLFLESEIRALAAQRLLEQEARTAAARRHLEEVA
jgi:predicted site-specific integrase-resolvase